MKNAMKNARIVDVLDQSHVVLNVGSDDGVSSGAKFMIFAANREVHDLDGKSLGTLEITKGYGKATHVQSGMSIVKSELGTGFVAQPVDLVSALVFRSDKGDFLVARVGDFARAV